MHCICLLKEKDLIHKLFQVLVPRYQDYETSFTQMWNLPIQYPGPPIPHAVLELKGKIQINRVITGKMVVQHYAYGNSSSHWRKEASELIAQKLS